MTTFTYPPFGAVNLANPTAKVGTAAVNGTAKTAMRSDAAPAIDQAANFAFSNLGATTIPLGAITTNIKGINLTATFNNGTQVFDAPLFLNVTNTASAAGSVIFDFQSGGVSRLSYSVNSTTLNVSGAISLGSGSSTIGASGSTLSLGFSASGSVGFCNGFIVLNQFAVNGWQFGQTNSASPAAQSFTVPGARAGTDNNTAGAKFSISPGAGTGNAAPNPLQFNSYVAVASGSTVQTLTNTLTLNSGLLQFNQYTTAGLLQNDASGNVTTNTAVNASTIPANFIAADRLTIVIAGTTYYIPLATIAF